MFLLLFIIFGRVAFCFELLMLYTHTYALLLIPICGQFHFDVTYSEYILKFIFSVPEINDLALLCLVVYLIQTAMTFDIQLKCPTNYILTTFYVCGPLIFNTDFILYIF